MFYSNHQNSYSHDNMLSCAPDLFVYIYICHARNMYRKTYVFRTFRCKVFQFPMSKFLGEMLFVPTNCASTIIRTVCPPLLGCTPSKFPSFVGHRLWRENSIMSSRYRGSECSTHVGSAVPIDSHWPPRGSQSLWCAGGGNHQSQPGELENAEAGGWGSGQIWSHLEQVSHQKMLVPQWGRIMRIR